MLPKKDITKNACSDAIEARNTFELEIPELICKSSCFLYATETDKANRLIDELAVIFYKAMERAEREMRRMGGDVDA